MTDENSNTSEGTNFRERLVLVEQQQQNQKEVLMDVNETLKEVVKTQYVLANQREEIDRLTKENEYIARRLHEREVEEARTALLNSQQTVVLDALQQQMQETVIPHQNKVKTYIKLGGGAIAATWSAFIVYLQFFFGG